MNRRINKNQKKIATAVNPTKVTITLNMNE